VQGVAPALSPRRSKGQRGQFDGAPAQVLVVLPQVTEVEVWEQGPVELEQKRVQGRYGGGHSMVAEQEEEGQEVVTPSHWT